MASQRTKQGATMVYKSFYKLDKALDKLVADKKYTEALDLLTEGEKNLPSAEDRENRFELAWIKSVLYTMCGRYGECFDLIASVVDEGYPFPISFKRFDPLREKDGYRKLREKNDRLLAKVNAAAEPKYEVHLPDGYQKDKKYPLFLALHGHGMCNIREFQRYWRPEAFTDNGFIFAYVQSSQVVCHNGYGWMDDYEKSNRDIKKCLDAIAGEYPINGNEIMIGGFSGGAIASVNFAVSGIVPVKGFIGLCPEEKPPAFTKENVEKAAQSGARCVFMEGELMLPVADEEEMLKEFTEQGLPFEYYINKGIGHEAPEDLDDKLRRALEFILN
jgi:predicted esterase